MKVKHMSKAPLRQVKKQWRIYILDGLTSEMRAPSLLPFLQDLTGLSWCWDLDKSKTQSDIEPVLKEIILTSSGSIALCIV